MKAHRHTLLVLSLLCSCCTTTGGSSSGTSTVPSSSSLFLWLVLPSSGRNSNYKQCSVCWRDNRVGTRPLLAAVMPTTTPPTGGSVQEVQLRTLALHGSGGTAASFRDTLEQWNAQWWRNNHDANDDDDTDQQNATTLCLEVTALNAPHNKHDPDDAGASSSSSSVDHGGYVWWRMPPGVRSFTATKYDGFDQSAAAVLAALRQHPPPPMENPTLKLPSFDLIVAHSQGAILIAALLALQQIDRSCHPRLGYILNGVAWPNPYTNQFEELTDTAALSDVSILVLVGTRDRINPPDQASRVARALQRAGATVTVVEHPGGHSIPIESSSVGRKVEAWLHRDTRRKTLESKATA